MLVLRRLPSLVLLLLTCEGARAQQQASDLCFVPGCRCQGSPEVPDLTDVTCQCQPKTTLILGQGSKSSPRETWMPPPTARSLTLNGCNSVEILPQALNHLPMLSNLTVSASERLALGTRMYDSRRGTGLTRIMDVVDLSNIRMLDVSGQAFEGLSVETRVTLDSVYLPSVPSFSFSFDSVKEFSIMGDSRVDRVSMRGFRMEECGQFNVLQGTRFFSLARSAFYLRCDHFMLAYNTFVSLQDSSFDVRFGMADIQGNTFESLTGKPFNKLRPAEPESDEVPIGFVFRDNMFSADPTLPFGTLAFPSFDVLDPEVNHVVIENNHFRCDCDRVGWVVGAAVHGFDRDVVRDLGDDAAGYGSMMFLDELYRTSGNCLQCGLRECTVDETRTFMDFAETALVDSGGELRCASTGLILRSQNPEAADAPRSRLIPPKNSYAYEAVLVEDGGGNPPPRLTRPPTSRPRVGRPSTTSDEEAGTRDLKTRELDSGAPGKTKAVGGLALLTSLMVTFAWRHN